MPETERPLLTQRQAEVLALTGQGLTSGEAAEKLGISIYTAKNLKNGPDGAFARLGAEDAAQAIRIALEEGHLDLEKLSAGLNPERYRTLSKQQRETFNQIFREENLVLGQKEFSGNLIDATSQAIKQRLSLIYSKLGVRNHAQAFVFKMELDRYRLEHPDIDELPKKPVKKKPPSEEEMASLLLVGLGKVRKEISYTLKIVPTTLKYRIDNVKLKLGARTSAEAIYIACQSNRIKPQDFTQKFNFNNYENLTSRQQQLLNKVLSPENLPLQIKEVAQKLNITGQTLKNYLHEIYGILGVTNLPHAAMFMLSRQTILGQEGLIETQNSANSMQIFP